MYQNLLANQVIDLERRIQIENEKHGNPIIDKYALLPHAVEHRKKEEKLSSRGGLLASLKSLASQINFLG